MAGRIESLWRKIQLVLESAGTLHLSCREKKSSRETLHPNRGAKGSPGPTHESYRAAPSVDPDSISRRTARSIRHIAVEAPAIVPCTNSPNPASRRRLDLSCAGTWHETHSRSKRPQKRFQVWPSRRTLASRLPD